MDFGFILYFLCESWHYSFPAVDRIATKFGASLFEFVPFVLSHELCLHVTWDQHADETSGINSNLVHEWFNAILAHDRLAVVVLLGEPVENSLGHSLVKCFCSSSRLLQLDSVREEVINSLVDIPEAKSDAVWISFCIVLCVGGTYHRQLVSTSMSLFSLPGGAETVSLNCCSFLFCCIVRDATLFWAALEA